MTQTRLGLARSLPALLSAALLAAFAAGCKCSGDSASTQASSQFRALPPNACTLTDIPGCTDSCDKGDVKACATLGYIYLQRETRDLAKAEAANKKACDSGIMLACVRLSEIILGVDDRRAEWPKALEVFRDACEQREFIGCYQLGKVYETGKAVAADKPKAIELYKKACDNEQGFAGACARLWVIDGHALPWRSRKGFAVQCMEDFGDCPPAKK